METNGVYLTMIRLFFSFITRFFFGPHWRFPQFIVQPARLLYEKALVLSTVFVGRSGVGKTYAMAVELLELMKAHPEQAFIIFDWSGGLIVILMLLILSDRDSWKLLPRLVYDAMGGRIINGRSYVMPMPEFSEKYDPEKPWLERVEDQVDRVQRVFEALNEELIKRNPTLGARPIKSLLANLLLLANAVTDKRGNSWQITEVTRLLNEEMRKNIRQIFGGKVKKANDYFKYTFTGESKLDRDMANALADVLDILKSRRVRARVGYPFPGWNLDEAAQKGQIIFCDGSALTNNHNQKDYLFLQLLFLFVDALNKRPASRPGYQPINLIIDEGYTFTENRTVARILSHFPSEYRSRLLQFFYVIQSPKQLPGGEDGKKGLADMFFSFSNMVVFSLLDIDDCTSVVKNFFPFDPQMVKVPSQREGQHNIMENRDEQLAVKAYQLQRLAQRECYIRRFIDEARMDKIIHVGRTRDVRITATDEDVENLKDKLMLERGVLLSEAEKVIGERSISVQQVKPTPQRKPRRV
jgi:hypothetical protein